MAPGLGSFQSQGDRHQQTRQATSISGRPVALQGLRGREGSTLESEGEKRMGCRAAGAEGVGVSLAMAGGALYRAEGPATPAGPPTGDKGRELQDPQHHPSHLPGCRGHGRSQHWIPPGTSARRGRREAAGQGGQQGPTVIPTLLRGKVFLPTRLLLKVNALEHD